jgi:hypothetical protein
MFVIQSALIRLFDPITFDTSSIKPLSLEKFTTYILIPIVACYLIKDDMGCSVAEAYDHMADSAQVGLMLQDLEDDEDGAVDDIHRENMRLAKREREGYTEPTGPVLKVGTSLVTRLHSKPSFRTLMGGLSLVNVSTSRVRRTVSNR